MRRGLVGTLILALLLGGAFFAVSRQGMPTATGQQAPTKPPPRKKDASDLFFEQGRIPELRIQLPKEQADKLRAEPRKYVRCDVVEDGGTVYKKVGIKLKGAAGSFRNLDDRPALTLNMDKNAEGQLFHGMDKFHLNNSVQDESLLNELICSELSRDMGLPAPRVSHARVWINDRDLGIYVLKEGFDQTFLARHFADPTGNFYDGGFCQEIDGNMEKDSGKGPDDLSDVKELIAACREPDAAKRMELLAAKVNVEAYLNFLALETLTCHWDGYNFNRNNYRFYFAPPEGQVVFLAHGMDQMFGDPNFPIFNHPGPLVGNAIFQNAEWRSRYRERITEVRPLFAPQRLHAKIDAVHARVRPVIAKMGEDRAKHFDDRVRDFKHRIEARYPRIEEQLRNGPPEPLKFTAEGIAALPEWYVQKETDDSVAEEVEVQGQKLYHLACGPSNRCVASWRKKVLLARGVYRLEGRMRVTGVNAIPGDPKLGLGLRMSGGERANKLVGTTNWEKISHVIEIGEDTREVELVAELRSVSGKAWIDIASLRLVKGK
jgi:hypothetical protein